MRSRTFKIHLASSTLPERCFAICGDLGLLHHPLSNLIPTTPANHRFFVLLQTLAIALTSVNIVATSSQEVTFSRDTLINVTQTKNQPQTPPPVAVAKDPPLHPVRRLRSRPATNVSSPAYRVMDATHAVRKISAHHLPSSLAAERNIFGDFQKSIPSRTFRTL
ncbi:hypothetical protein HYDPIDRAFT_114089 [Hydnomerulius pinastri MD-312]|uniref:Uncharacterized protein n=1 Tax=Hydnomerulius pinastri MD-312 TaxID=994086 RepID=A0A0C9VBB4_9AGAM|nr:hypothetical protein HYDPIDRAFT_114089 [Hydnomerulius pinastri MD-312]